MAAEKKVPADISSAASLESVDELLTKAATRIDERDDLLEQLKADRLKLKRDAQEQSKAIKNEKRKKARLMKKVSTLPLNDLVLSFKYKHQSLVKKEEKKRKEVPAEDAEGPQHQTREV